jgi:hypothetical protein
MAPPLVARLCDNGNPTIPLSVEQKESIDNMRTDLSAGTLHATPNPCLCEASDDMLVACRDRYGFSINTQLCLACGLMRSDPFYDDASLNQFYSKYYRKIYSPHLSPEDLFQGEWTTGEKIASLLRLHHLPVPAVVAEAGCGAGGTIAYFQSSGANSWGIEPDPHLNAFCACRKLDVLPSIPAPSTRPLADLLILYHSLEHFRSPLDELKRLLPFIKEDGLVYISVPGIHNVRNAYVDLGRFLQNAHAWHFCLDTCDWLMSRAGCRRIVGDESISSLYRRNADMAPLPSPASSARIVQSIRLAEQLRHLPRAHVATGKLKHAAYRLAGDLAWKWLKQIRNGRESR